MKHFGVFCTLLVAMVCYGNVYEFEKQSDSRPNFVIFFADDIGWGDFGANWEPNKKVTPNLNQLASEGIRLTDFHSAASVCTPSRASLLTGRIGLRTGVIRNFVQESVGGLPLNETTIAEALKPLGYMTGMIGKWHLGMTEKFHPRSRGFDYYYGLPYSNDMGCVDVHTYNLPECKSCSLNQTIGCAMPSLPLFDQYEIVEQPADLNQLGDHYVAKASEFIESTAKSNKPFLLYVALAHMHVPMAHASRFTNSTDVHTIFADTLHEMDDMIGRIVKSLKANDVYNNTVTWFTGDNGPWEMKCQYSGSPGPFLGTWLRDTYGGGTASKTSTWEAGHREPSLVVWPDVIAPGQVSDALGSTLDIFPTLVSLAGGKLLPDRMFDGIDLTSFLKGETTHANSVLYHPNSGDTFRIGEIDTIRMGPYKVFWKTGGRQMDCNGKVAPQVDHDPPLLFNVVNDPAESTPLTAETLQDYKQVIAQAIHTRQDFLDSVKSDNTTVADYTNSPSAALCCDSQKTFCRCKKD